MSKILKNARRTDEFAALTIKTAGWKETDNAYSVEFGRFERGLRTLRECLERLHVPCFHNDSGISVSKECIPSERVELFAGISQDKSAHR